MPAGSDPRRQHSLDTALRAFRVRYADNTITRDAIFDYVYGVLHAPGYRERFANDLSKGLPRIPFAPDFRAFAEAGRALAALHLGYETGPQYRLEAVAAHGGEISEEDCRIGERAMRFANDGKTTLIVNDRLRIVGIPAEAHGYEVNGRTPLEWLVDRYRIARDRESGIVNDPQRVVRRSPRPDRRDPPGRPSQRRNRPHRGRPAGAVPDPHPDAGSRGADCESVIIAPLLWQSATKFFTQIADNKAPQQQKFPVYQATHSNITRFKGL